MMRNLAELLRASGPVFEGEGEGAGGGQEAKPDAPKPEAPKAEAPAVEAKPEAKPEAEAKPDTAAPAAKAEAPKPDWRDRRIAELTARLREAKPAPQAPSPSAPLNPTEDFNRRVADAAAAQASQLVRMQKFTDDCNALAAEGKKTFGADFDSRVNALQNLVIPNDAQSTAAYFQFLQAAIDTGEGPKVLYELGEDLDEAQRIMGLSPTKMAIELTKRGFAEPTATPSSAPKPITPVEAKGGRHEAIDPTDPERADNIPIGEWMRRRQAQVDAANGVKR